MTERDDAIRAARRRFGELLDQIDAQTRRPGEPALRRVVSEHARERLAAMRCPNDACEHGTALHDIEEMGDPRPRCCVEGCDCGASPADR